MRTSIIKITAFSFIMISLFMGCKKENLIDPMDTPEDDPEIIIEIEKDTFNSSIPFEVGIVSANIDTVSHTSYPSTFQGMEFDIDGDSLIDISFSKFFEMSSGGIRKNHFLSNINNDKISFLLHSVPDTIRKCSYFPNDSFKITRTYNRFATIECPENGIDTISKTEIDTVLLKFNKGDQIPSEQYWSQENLILAHTNTSGYQWEDSNGVVLGFSFHTYKGDWATDYWTTKGGYVVFRYLLENGEYRYGWAKVHVTENTFLFISEVAFERLVP
ncbi:MAG: hypothetical protein HKO66_14215 [Saprospiraceae bacterium]|nr:hypothetical protein [Bacteroidia bacterium]NNL93392.1 hypothetical protein [Saprospiraceae bacterium]